MARTESPQRTLVVGFSQVHDLSLLTYSWTDRTRWPFHEARRGSHWKSCRIVYCVARGCVWDMAGPRFLSAIFQGSDEYVTVSLTRRWLGEKANYETGDIMSPWLVLSGSSGLSWTARGRNHGDSEPSGQDWDLVIPCEVRHSGISELAIARYLFVTVKNHSTGFFTVKNFHAMFNSS